jgi:cytoskeletal protein CcmA (bactofilin family)
MSAAEIANIYSSINNIQLGLNEVTGNTFSNYNQLSRIVSQQANIYNSVYYGAGDINSRNLSVNTNALISGILNVDNGTLYVDNTNNRVGINTTTPNSDFQVNGSATISSARFGDLTSTQVSVISTSASASNYGFVSEATSTAQRTHMGFRTPVATGGEIGRIITQGKDLHLTNGSNGSNILIYGGNLNVLGDTLYAQNGSNRVGINNKNPQFDLDVKGSANVSGNIICANALITGNLVISNGNVGINNTNPQYNLDIKGSANISNTLFVNKNQAFNCYLTNNQLNSSYDTNGESELALNYAGYLGGTTQFRNTTFYNGKNTAIARLLGSTGNFGIGTITPTAKLEVNGSVKVSGTTSLLGVLLNASNMDLSTLTYVQAQNNGYIRFGNIMVQWGTIGDSASQTATFSPAFTAQPYVGFVQRQSVTGAGSNNPGPTIIYSLSSTSMLVDSVYGSTDKSSVYWLVIGEYNV